MKPNLARIPAAGDARAEAITRRARTAISQSLLDSLDKSDAEALGRYGARQPTIALRQKSAQHLEDALLASALAQLVRQSDPRDLMVGLAVHYIVAEQIGAVPSVVFEDVAHRLPHGSLPDLLLEFGARQDITLEAFGWQLVQTAEGPDFMPA
jgi:glycine/D-amino acid oxidase-like deaminating enzyme